MVGVSLVTPKPDDAVIDVWFGVGKSVVSGKGNDCSYSAARLNRWKVTSEYKFQKGGMKNERC